MTEKNLTLDPSKFWSYVNSKRKTSGYPSKMFKGARKSDTAEGICNLFADFFEGTYATDDPDDMAGKTFEVAKTVDIGGLVLTEDTVLRALQSIKTSKGDGPDNISPLFIKECACSLLQPLHSIFNLSLSSRSFPSRWKVSRVKPIFKSGTRNDIENWCSHFAYFWETV